RACKRERGLQGRAPPGRQPAARRYKPSPARGLTLPNRDCSGDPMHKAAGVGCVRGFAGPMEATW
ncbi:MAG: hypothetical protein EBY28_23630, partial [Betaproteobacteria bacterium]|nr:hypothetical protein [Betaproteobacteria bacterium]